MRLRTRDSIVHYLRTAVESTTRVSDSALLVRYSRHGDDAAFDELLARHGSMLWNVCLRQTADRAAAEDVFQATCLVLARKAGQIARPESLSCWLHGVAVRIARREYDSRLRSREESGAVEERAVEPNEQVETREIFQLLDRELQAIPEYLRSPLVLCYLEGKTRDDAAAELGLSLGTLKRRLEEGRENLRQRLIRRGGSLPSVLLIVAAAESAVPAGLLAAVRTTGPSGRAATLAFGELSRSARRMQGGLALLGLGVVVAGLAAAIAPSNSVVVAPVHRAEGRERFDDDPLPDGAVARLGTPRFRLPPGDRTLALAADGKTLAVGHPGGLIWIDTESGRELRRLELKPSRTRPVAISSDGRVLAAVEGSRVLVWDAKSGKEIARIEDRRRRPPGITTLALRGNGGLLALGDTAGGIRLASTADASISGELAGHAGEVRKLRFSPDGKLLGSSGTDGTVRVWDAASTKELLALAGQSPQGASIAFDPAGKRLAVAGPKNATFSVFDLATAKAIWTYSTRGRAARAGFTDAAFTSDGKHALAGTSGGGMWVWTREGELVRESPLAPNGRMGDVAMVGNLAVATSDSTLYLWDPVSGRETAGSVNTRAQTHSRYVTGLHFSPDGRAILSSDLATVRCWDPLSGKLQLRSASAFGELARFCPDGKHYYAVRTSDGCVWKREAATGKVVEEFTVASAEPVGLAGFALSPNADRLAVIDGKGSVRLLALPDGKTVESWSIEPLLDRFGRTRGLAFSGDGKSLAIADRSGDVRIVSAREGSETARIANVGNPIEDLALDRDAATVLIRTSAAADGEDRRVSTLLWDVATDKRVLSYGDPAAPIPAWAGTLPNAQRIAVSADGKHVATTDGGTEVRLWDRRTGKLVRTISGHAESVAFLAFSPDGRLLATMAVDGIGLVWRIDR